MEESQIIGAAASVGQATDAGRKVAVVYATGSSRKICRAAPHFSSGPPRAASEDYEYSGPKMFPRERLPCDGQVGF